MKRFLINFSLIITALIIYFLQENFFNWFTIAGVMPNLFVIYILFIGLFYSRTAGMTFGIGIRNNARFIYREKSRDYSYNARDSWLYWRNV